MIKKIDLKTIDLVGILLISALQIDAQMKKPAELGYPLLNANSRWSFFSSANRYVQSATLDGKTWNKSWFYHEDFVDGGKLILNMGSEANEDWGSDP
jgi:hypothetical protein